MRLAALTVACCLALAGCGDDVAAPPRCAIPDAELLSQVFGSGEGDTQFMQLGNGSRCLWIHESGDPKLSVLSVRVSFDTSRVPDELLPEGAVPTGPVHEVLADVRAGTRSDAEPAQVMGYDAVIILGATPGLNIALDSGVEVHVRPSLQLDRASLVRLGDAVIAAMTTE